ncbi:FKBP-type peptidyl-prolyl cis-trans isomerase [Paenalcaligenes niemegkensis]|uniref:FKBP-type peptidyl-prolyl cis-trans isomerase n=1 Tax=Paenalcaligenes niemegkensis TaxID=2895469 RepID=UPI001EE8D03B|nr:FKBP-type peptidyl-prolyl cis-trans isomerase [Paenalcaligenes niemegkensis]MCQ9616842.1 FKBP-type peptidyl-prolyl cis-trans isomerase [Paenalcaligenes niemegkensis]
MTSHSDASALLVREDSYLTLHYCIQIMSGPAAGTMFANTFDGHPATLQMGAGQWSSGLEEVLIGQQEGATIHADLPPEKAYGDRNPALLQWVSKAMLAENAAKDDSFSPGDMVEFSARNGSRYSGVLKQLNDEAALFDFNHPLAGADIRLDVKILGIL